MLMSQPSIIMILLVMVILIGASVLIAYLFGGRGVGLSLLALAGAAVCWLAWFFLIRDRADWTGMEGITMIVIPALFVAVSFCGFIGYAVVAILGKLPDQRL